MVPPGPRLGDKGTKAEAYADFFGNAIGARVTEKRR
jgi:hypothetical protein